jgi:hypothetical protein
MKTIAFYQPHLDIRGTGVSNFDYAVNVEKILGHKAVMICDKDDRRSHPLAVKKFKDQLNVIELPGHEDMGLLEAALADIHADAVYIQKCGARCEGRFTQKFPTFIHCVGHEYDPHGTVYAYVSEWSARTFSQGRCPWVPYIVQLPAVDGDLRAELGIPREAVVFGRLGGPDTWNLPWANFIVERILKEKPDYYFIFALTPKFINHPRALFLDAFADVERKTAFINTCDAMLHARAEGESFGAAIAEFSIRNKPVITWNGSPERCHIDILKDKGLYYANPHGLYKTLRDFKPQPELDWNCYRDFSPEKVMAKFDEVFLQKLG